MKILLLLLFPVIAHTQTVTRTEFNALLARVKALEARKTVVIGGTVTTGGGVDTIKIPAVSLVAINLRADSLVKAFNGLNTATFLATQKVGLRVDTVNRRIDNLPVIDLTTSPVIKSLQAIDANLFTGLNNISATVTAVDGRLIIVEGKLTAVKAAL